MKNTSQERNAGGSSGIPQIDFFKGRLEIFHGIGEEMLSRCTFQALITYF